MELKKRWDARFPGSPGIGRDLLARYAEPHRHYHDRRHLADVLTAVDELADQGERPEMVETVELAVWFHDAVYDVRAVDSERRSWELAQDLLVGVFPSATITEVCRLIALTVDHAPEAWDTDGAIVCDADLSVLAREADGYDDYAQSVRQEYAHVDDASFRAGRAKVLERLLGFEQLFTTDYALDSWEPPARANLERELADLRA